MAAVAAAAVPKVARKSVVAAVSAAGSRRGPAMPALVWHKAANACANVPTASICQRRPLATRCAAASWPSPAVEVPVVPSSSSSASAPCSRWRSQHLPTASASGARRHSWCSTEEAKQSEEDGQETLEFQRRYQEFKKTLRDPDYIWVRGSEVRKKFMLSKADLKELSDRCITKENPFDSETKDFIQYPLKDVVEMSLKKWGEEALLNHYIQQQVDADEITKIYGHHQDEDDSSTAGAAPGPRAPLGKMYWYNAPSTSTMEGRQSVLQGLRTNAIICCVKGGVWSATGSHAMFADWMHSIADVANYSYRLMELSRSGRHRDISHPYGYAPLRYITADRSFVFLGVVGGIFPLISAAAELGAHGWCAPVGGHLAAPAVVFLISGALEAVAVKTAYREILSQAAQERVSANRPAASAGYDAPEGHGWPRKSQLGDVLRYLREGRDVMSTATFTEASTGVLGAFVGLFGLGASAYFQSGLPDVFASVVMAAAVCGLSGFLLGKSGNALLGQTLPWSRVKTLVALLEAHPAIVDVYDVKTELVGTDTVRFKAEVQFNPQVITQCVLRRGPRAEGSRPSAAANPGAAAGAKGDAAAAAGRSGEGRGGDPRHQALERQMQELLPQLRSGLPAGESEEDWLVRSNSIFYESLAWQLKDVEGILRHELRDFRNVHIDLEPW